MAARPVNRGLSLGDGGGGGGRIRDEPDRRAGPVVARAARAARPPYRLADPVVDPAGPDEGRTPGRDGARGRGPWDPRGEGRLPDMGASPPQ